MSKRPISLWSSQGGAAVAMVLFLSTLAPSAGPGPVTSRARLGAPVALPGSPESEFQDPAAGVDSVIPPSAGERFIDLEAALTLAGAENPTIALAREAVQASLAQQMQARALMLPTLDAGMDFNLHRGPLQSAEGNIQDVDRQSLYAGGGAAAVGGGTVGVPGVRLTAHVADAWFEPKVARQVVVGREFDARAARNDLLLEVTGRFFALAGAEATLKAAWQSEKEAAEVARLTFNLARAGQRRQGDADRAYTQALLLTSAIHQAQEGVAVAGAELVRLLNADPAIRLRVPDAPLPEVQLVDPNADLESLVRIALRNRPEMVARGADVAAAEVRLRKERARPFLPVLTVAFSAGEFGGGSNLTDTSFGHFNGRTDFDAVAFWSLENLGLGNLAVQRRLRAQLGEAEAERILIIDRIRREVADAHAQVAARRVQLAVHRKEVERAELAFREDLLGMRNLVARPIEVLRSLTMLATARPALIAALVGYNQAQFQLFVALGQPPSAGPR